MGEGLNKVMLIGNLGGPPELRYTGSGTPLMTIRMASNERQKINDEWKDITEWHRVIVWGRRAEGLNKILQKGTQIYVEGRLQTRDWTDKDKIKRYTTEVVALKVLLLGRKNGGGGGDYAPPPNDNDYHGGYSGSNRDSGSYDSSGGSDFDDDDVPF